MTEKLSQLLNLPPLPETTKEQAESIVEENKQIIETVDAAISKIDAALPMVHDLAMSDNELDELALMAKEKAEDLIDLGMNIDPRFAGVIMQTAGVMLGHAISAKTAKIDKKLKIINLQLAKAKLDHQIAKDSKTSDSSITETPVDGQGMILDRNDLLKQILDQAKTQKK
jgi:hypothetical protein